MEYIKQDVMRLQPRHVEAILQFQGDTPLQRGREPAVLIPAQLLDDIVVETPNESFFAVAQYYKTFWDTSLQNSVDAGWRLPHAAGPQVIEHLYI